MFGSVGLPELVVIFVLALLLFGPRKLPEIGRSVGRALGEFRRASNDLRRTVEEEVALEDLRQAGTAMEEAADLTPTSSSASSRDGASPPAGGPSG